MTANIAATGSTAAEVVDVALAGPVRPRGFVGCNGVTVRNMVFLNFFFAFFTTFYVVLFLPTLFSQFHSSRKDNTRAIDPMM